MADDIEDSSLKRRGEPCLHLVYGIDVALNVGNFLCFTPLHYLSKIYPDPTQYGKIVRHFTNEMNVVHFGQNWDIEWHNGR